MYLGIDIGGTKTLVAVLDERGVILEKVKFPTPTDYSKFVAELEKTLQNLHHHDFIAAGVGIPAADIDRKRGVGISFSNLPWHMVSIRADIARLADCPVALDNDAKLAGLSEAMLLKQYSKVLYVTISTGIGTALVVDQRIDDNVGDAGGANLMVEHHGKLVPWESFASGKAIVQHFGKPASDINDEATWKTIVHDWSRGLLEFIAVMQPDVIVIGGSVGTHFEKYQHLLIAEMARYETPLLPMPLFKQAQRPEEAVVFGAYDLARQEFGSAR